ncbi:MAG: hypothetical protein MK538_19745, partial [Planctomycetes bacterium]|nr:hypothetical protein [Planctomycetota bacterium]
GAKYPTATYPGGKELSSLWFRYEMHANAWNAQTFWWHWHYTRNQNFLKETGYEVIREVTAFFLNYLVKEDDGLLSIYPTMSPEQGDWMIRNPTIDLALVRELFEAFLETSAVLNRDQELRDQCHTALSRLSAYPRNDSILLDYDDARPNLPLCHAALLAPVYPGSEVSPDSSDKELFGLASRTLDGILERTARSIPNFPIDMKTWNDDMTWPWLACIAARMQRPDLCLAYLRDLGLLVHLKPNGFFTVVAFAPGFQDKYLGLDPVRMEPMLNSGPGLVAAINEMLLQSFDGRIRLFPAVPDDWDVRFAQLRAVGGFLVSAERHGGKVEYCIIESECGQTCCVANPWSDQDVVVTELSSASETVVPAETPELAFDTETSCVYRIEPKGHTRPKTPQMLTATQRPAPRIHKGPGDLGSNHEREKHQVTLGL